MRDECKFIKHANKRDLIILIEESGDNIIVKEHFSANGTQLDTLVFKDLTLKTNSINENVIQGAYGLSNDGGYHSTGATVNEVDIVYGMLGNDYIWTYGGKDKIYGGKGKDYLRGGKSDDQLYGGIGDDRLYGDEGNDKLYGNEGDDKLNGGSGHDVISGGAGNDILYGGIGDDELDGGEGVNTYHFVKGFGNDVIKGNNINDCIVFDDIKSDEVLVERRMNDLLIKTTFDSSSIQVNDYFVNPGVKGIEFFNDVFWNHDEIEYRLANDETPPANIKSLKKGFGSILLDTVDSQDEVVFINFEDIAIDEVKVKRSYIYHEGDSRFGLKLEVLSTHDFIGIFNYFDEENKQEFSSNKNIGGIKFSTGEFYSKDALNNELTKICQTATEENPILSYSGKLIMNHSYYGGDNLNAKLIGGEGDDYLNLDNSEGVALGHGGDDTLYSGSKISTLYGGDGNDELYGGDNTSILDGGTGNDDLVSGSGNEIMIGGSGNDTFKFAYDFGNDVIRFSDTYVDTDKDEVIIHGIPYEDLSFSYDETLDTLEIICEKQDSKLSIEGFLSPNNKIKNYRFTIGWGTEIKSLSHQEMKNNVITEEIYGDEHDNVISTVDMVSRNRIYGLDGNDKITSGINDDTLIGGNGNDILTGNGGNDILNGGAGDDSLDGGYGIDIYEFGRGYGRDTIKTYRFTSFWEIQKIMVEK